MRLLVWQWGRFGAGPRFAMELARNVAAVPGTSCGLSLSTGAEIMRGPAPPDCALPVTTYANVAGFAARLLLSPFALRGLVARVRALAPDAAVCAMPAPLDGLMAAALRRAGIPYFVVVHDADPHPGDGVPFQMALQRRLVGKAAGLVALTGHVADRLRQQGLAEARPILRASLPPLSFGPLPPPPRAQGGPLRLLLFGRLLPYKGLDLFAAALRQLGARPDLTVRVVGLGPDSPVLAELRALGAEVSNRWVPEDEVGSLLAWADAVVLSHREASQSGVAAAAMAARRWIVATRVGGLAEQLADEPLAVLCAPAPDSLAAAIRGLLDGPGPAPGTADAAAAWQGTATRLVRDIGAVVRAL